MKKHLVFGMLFYFCVVKSSFLAIVFLMLSLCAQAQKFPTWLVGKWEIPSQSAMSGSSYEEWTKITDNHIEGKTYRLFGNEIMVFDQMIIKVDGGRVVLRMSAEKEGKRFEANFIGTMLCEDVWAFECPEADSPSAIYYINLGDGQVYVWTEVKTSFDVCSDFIMYKK